MSEGGKAVITEKSPRRNKRRRSSRQTLSEALKFMSRPYLNESPAAESIYN